MVKSVMTHGLLWKTVSHWCHHVHVGCMTEEQRRVLQEHVQPWMKVIGQPFPMLLSAVASSKGEPTLRVLFQAKAGLSHSLTWTAAFSSLFRQQYTDINMHV